MKKVLFITLLLMSSVITLKAECSYKELRELNTFASYIETSYNYNETTDKFDLTITNLSDKVYITGKIGEFYYPENGEVHISNLNLGTTYKYQAYSSTNTECSTELLRVITVSIPYKNYYYGSAACEGHEDLNVCNSKFLDYEISENTFLSLLNKKIETIDNKKDETKEVEKTLWEQAIEYISKIYIKVILVIVTSIITISIYQVILRKVKHGF